MRSQVIVDWVAFLTVDIAFLENWELDSISVSEGSDFFGCAWFLLSKLVAWERKNLKTFACVIFVHLNQLLVVLVSQSSL